MTTPNPERTREVSEFSDRELHNAVSGLAAMAEHDAAAAENRGAHGAQLENARRYARMIRAAANRIPNGNTRADKHGDRDRLAEFKAFLEKAKGNYLNPPPETSAYVPRSNFAGFIDVLLLRLQDIQSADKHGDKERVLNWLLDNLHLIEVNVDAAYCEQQQCPASSFRSLHFTRDGRPWAALGNSRERLMEAIKKQMCPACDGTGYQNLIGCPGAAGRCEVCGGTSTTDKERVDWLEANPAQQLEAIRAAMYGGTLRQAIDAVMGTSTPQPESILSAGTEHQSVAKSAEMRSAVAIAIGPNTPALTPPTSTDGKQTL